MSAEPLVLLERADDVARLTLNRPGRHNSLVPPLIEAMEARLADLAAAPPRVLVLTGAGRSFSTGGDLRGFLETPRHARRAYAEQLVGGLHRVILALARLPMPVVARVQGPVTGGSLGLVLSADLVVMVETAFIAPYYVEVGFAPDGGWTALLPERVGAARALAIQLLNRRIDAAEARALGLAHESVPAGGIDAAVEALVTALLAKSAGSLAATKALIWPERRLAALRDRLDAELAGFLARIDTPETEARIRSFLEMPA
ncbi:enoyl-CoA hydratase/isomerase family protein [Rhabdaerophilum calidifontis]|uniref:enoyl-CoA hydratase/isomerase family protein n=1 Tax=Rhabdaerophilum calidifontis TaxID=2604328 RepID=UPI001239CD2A|nr:enoyl-CoA hydratase/isomerase family protein [Rhabdaerophilum calidifontis]